jgi:hypothetical protein
MKKKNMCNIKHSSAGKGSRLVKYNKKLYDTNYDMIKWNKRNGK